MDPPGKPTIMLGYCDTQKIYRLWSEQEHKLFTARDIKFFKDAQHTTKPRTAYIPYTNSQPLEDPTKKITNDKRHGFCRSIWKRRFVD